MRSIDRFSNAPCGQVLLATLLFCFIFSAVFLGLFQAGMAYSQKERTRRACDLTLLSAGSVYANGLQWVRYSNVLLMLSVAGDLAMMGMAIAPFIPGFPLTVPEAMVAAKQADPHTRRKVQLVQSHLFGIPLPDPRRKDRVPRPLGIYPTWMEWEGHRAAGRNGFQQSPMNVQFFYNLPSPWNSLECRIPDMALRFRRADELLPKEPSPLYSLHSDGKRHYFSQDQVEPAQNPRDPDQMRVRSDLPSPFAGRWVRKENRLDPKGPDPLTRSTGIGPSTWDLLRPLLKDIVLDVTHREEPSYHALSLAGRSAGTVGRHGSGFLETAGVVLEGGGLAAWDLDLPPFKVHLQRSRLTPWTKLPMAPGTTLGASAYRRGS